MTRLNHNKPPAQPLLMLCALFMGMIMFPGCDKFEGDQNVPAYLQIDSLGFSSDYDTQGTEKQEIVDAWIYVDDNLVGGFEMPALIPVLAEGKHKLEIRPGIILNGISDTRAPYPCIEPMIFESVRFTADSITVKYAGTSYYDNAEFVWMEDFEDASLVIKASANSDTGIYRTSSAGAAGAFIDPNSMYSGISYLDSTNPYLQLVSEEGNGAGFAFDRGDFIFLELHYKNDTPVAVGVYIKLMDGTVQERPFLILSPSAGWNKIYVNFTPIVNETVDAVNYTFYFEAQLPDDTENAFVMLDNIKLVTRPNL